MDVMMNDLLSIVSLIMYNEYEEDNCDQISSSSSEEDSNDEETEMRTYLSIILMMSAMPGETSCTLQLTGYVERIVAGYSRENFKEHFRFVHILPLSVINKCT